MASLFAPSPALYHGYLKGVNDITLVHCKNNILHPHEETRSHRSLNMVSAKSLVLLIGAVAPAAVMAAPTEATVAAPPVVQIVPTPEYMPTNTAQKTPIGPAGNTPNTISGTKIKFWKTRLFKGQSITTILDQPAGTCYSFQGSVWGEFNKNTDSVEILEGGPCMLYTGLNCNTMSLGPLHKAQAIPDMGIYYWTKQAGSIKCEA
ncbi:hypothetical protein RB595_006968 [Gaeumannomyces hyphopodioides]